MIGALDGLVEHEGGMVGLAVADRIFGERQAVSGIGEPLVIVRHGFGVAFLRVELAGRSEALSRRFVEGNAIAGYVGEEGTAARELVVHVHQRMDDEIDGG